MDLKVAGAGIETIVDRMTVLAYVRGQDLVITGKNMKATAPQIRFVPQVAGVAVIKPAVLNADGTTLTYKIETTFAVPNRWTLTVILGDKQFTLPDLVTITK